MAFSGKFQGGSKFGGNPRGGGDRREEFFRRAKKKVTVAISSRDNLLIQSVGAIDELNKASNLLFERLNEWYGMHFPEFKVADNAKYVQGVLVIDRDNLDTKEIERIFGPQAQSIIAKANASAGAKLPPADMAQLRELASHIQLLWKYRDSVEKYQEGVANEVCPNMSYIAGPALAAKLVAQAGGLHRLSTFPSSTVQVLGAEKALFKHLKSGSKPPKHGLIFQHPLVGQAPKKVRGKIARLLAGKLSIASKADAISHNFIAVPLKEKFEKNARKLIAEALSSRPSAGPSQ